MLEAWPPEWDAKSVSFQKYDLFQHFLHENGSNPFIWNAPRLIAACGTPVALV
jgi:hypothetical protein